jgi:hypothetical protein
MKGVELNFDAKSNSFSLSLAPAELEKEINAKSVLDYIQASEYAKMYTSEQEIKSACEQANKRHKSNDTAVINTKVGEKRNAEIEFKIADDAMTAHIAITAPYAGKTPSLAALVKMANKQGIVRGLGKKTINIGFGQS